MNVSENSLDAAPDAFPTWERVDTGPLSWVMSEIREAFDRSLESLRTFSQNRDDPTPLKLAKSNLHQAHGALQIVDLEGVSLLTEEIESLMEGFETTPAQCTPEAVEAIASAYRAVTEYLEELLAGAPHQPVRLFPSYRALLALRNAERIHPADLFYPDLSVRPPRASSGTGALLSPTEIAAQRSRFERALLQYLRDEKNLGAAAEMSAAVTVVESSPKQGQQRAFWWVTRAFFEALAGSAVPADLNVKRLCARINLQIRRLLDGSGMVAERLLRDTLFFVARSEPITAHIEEVKKVYALHHSLPDDFETERYGRIDFGALRNAKEALANAKAAWSHVVAGDVAQIAGFARDASALLAATGSLGRPGLAHVAQVVASLGTELSFDPRKPADGVGLDVATALLFLESALDQVRSLDESFDARADAVVARVEASAIGASVEGTDTPWLDEISRQAQERLTMASFISEMQANLRTIEKILDGFFREPSQRGDLPQAEKLLGQIGGALSVLGHEQAGLAIENGRDAIKRFGEEGYQPDPAEFGRVAESLGAVGFYIENLQHRADVGTVFKFDPQTGIFSADLTRGAVAKKAAEEEPDSDPEPPGPDGVSPPSGPKAGVPELSVENEIARHGDMVAELAENLRKDPGNALTRQQLSEALHRVQQDALLIDNSSLKDRAAQALKVLRDTSEHAPEDLTQSVFDLTDQTHRFGETWENAATAPIPEVTAPVPAVGTSIDAELLEIFLAEAVEVLGTARHALVKLGAQPGEREHLSEIRRAFHTLKGSGRMVGLNDLGEAAWAIEQTMNHWLSEGMAANPDLVTLLKRAIDALDGWVADLSELGHSQRTPEALCAAAQALRDGRPLDEPPAQPPLPDVARAASAASPAPAAPAASPSYAGERTEVVSPLRTMEIASEDYMETEVLASSASSRQRPPETHATEFVPPPTFPSRGPTPQVASERGSSSQPPSISEPPSPPQATPSPIGPSPTAPTPFEAIEAVAPVLIVPAMEIATEDYMATEVLTSRAPAQTPAQSDYASDVGSAPAAHETGTPISRQPAASDVMPAAPPAPAAVEAKVGAAEPAAPPKAFQDDDEQFIATEVLHEELDEVDPAPSEPSSLDFDFLHVARPQDANPSAAPQTPLITQRFSSDASAHAPQGDFAPAPAAPTPTPPTSAVSPSAPIAPLRAQPAEVEAMSQAGNDQLSVTPVPDPSAQGPTVLPFAMPTPSRTDELKQIGPLTLSVPLYNIYLSEADELLRTLTHDFGEWRHELNRNVSEAAVRAAHSLSGTSATIGLAPVHDLAYAIESVLQVLHRTPLSIGLAEVELLQDAVEGLRAMLHGFAAGSFPDTDVARIARLLSLRDELKARLLHSEVAAAPVIEDLGGPPSTADSPELHAPPTFDVPADSRAQVPWDEAHAGPDATSPVRDSPVEAVPVVAQNDETNEPDVASEQLEAEPDIVAKNKGTEAPGIGTEAQSGVVVQSGEGTSALQAATQADPHDPRPLATDTGNGHRPHDPYSDASLTETVVGFDEAPESPPAEHAGGVDWQAELPNFEPEEPFAPLVSVPPAVEESIDSGIAREAAQATEPEASHGAAPVADELPAPAAPPVQVQAPIASVPIQPAQPSAAIFSLEAVSHVRDEIDPELIEIFLQEASDYLPRIGESLRSWQQSPRDLSHPQSLLRLMHTIKGSARMAGAMRLGELVHNMESRVEGAVNLRDIPPGAFEDLLAAHDRTLELYDALMHPRPEVQPERRAVRRLEELEEREDPPLGAAAIPPIGQLPAVAGTALAFAAHKAQPGGPVAPTREVVQAVRVRADVLDRLVNQAGEVSISRSRLENEVGQIRSSLSDLTENLGRLRGQLREIEIQAETQMQSQLSLAKERERFDPLEFDRFTRLQELTRMMAESVNDVATVHQNLLRSLDGANRDLLAQQRMTRDLQQDLMRVRMVPFSSIAERLYRLVRQTAKELDKRVNLDIRGGGVEIDRSVLERMIAPFEHILRNAIVHGVEARALRMEKGKPETGELLIEVRQEGNEIVLVFSDDGAGLDLGRIREKGRAAGLIDSQDEIPDARASDLIFQPGFTTASEVTELAGRGVGMDVVRSEAGGLGGRVSVDSETNRGTRFTINLPLTLAVTQVVLVNVAGRTYALPSVLVEQVQQLRPQPLAQAYNDGQIVWLGQPVKLHFLAGLLGEKDRSPIAQRYSPVLILRSGGERIAIHVDEVIGNQEVVVKNIGPQLARMIGIAGATVLGSGDIVLILNPVQLAQKALRERPQPAVPAHPEIGGAVAELLDVSRRAEPVAGLETLPIVMVVDDSLTVRRVTQRLLMREGYQVVLAKDGVDALQQLQDYTPDAMLVDIEMPRMDGFDLTRNIRGDERYQRIPIIMITSRTADKHRSFALELGVDVYLGKPYQEAELLQHLARFVGDQKRATA